MFRATMRFPSDYPLSPPKLRFTTPLWHPNIYGPGARAGEVCISILHAPGNDQFGYERRCGVRRQECIFGGGGQSNTSQLPRW